MTDYRSQIFKVYHTEYQHFLLSDACYLFQTYFRHCHDRGEKFFALTGINRHRSECHQPMISIMSRVRRSIGIIELAN